MAGVVDTHTHLYFDQFQADLDEVIERAREAHVGAMINVGIDLASSQKAVELADLHDDIYATAGVHPHDVADIEKTDWDRLHDLLFHPKVVAIGEVGLDFYRDISPLDLQKRSFDRFMSWSHETGLPLVIHTREADEEIIRLLQERSKAGWRGVFHCFPGNENMAHKVLEMGFYISFTGNITFKNFRKASVVRSIPLDRLLLETDSPFMAPVPQRGKRNEPAFVQLVAQKLAEIHRVSVPKVCQQTTQNAIALFGIQSEHGDGW